MDNEKNLILFSDKLKSLLNSNLINTNCNIIENEISLNSKDLNKEEYILNNNSKLDNVYNEIEKLIGKCIDLIEFGIKDDNENTNNLICNLDEIKNKYEIQLKNNSNKIELNLNSLNLKYNEIINKKDENDFNEEKKINEEFIKLKKNTQADFSLIISKYLHYENNNINSFDDIYKSLNEKLSEIKEIRSKESNGINEDFEKSMKQLLSTKMKMKSYEIQANVKNNNFKNNIKKLINETLMKIK